MTATLEAPALEEAADDREPPEADLPVPAALAPWRDPHPWVGWLAR